MANILLIDDDARIRYDVVGQLSSRGHTVTAIAVSAAGAALTDLLWQTTRRPDVVVLDPDAPNIDGLQLVRMVRFGSGRPVIVTTAPCADGEIIQMLRAGADAYVAKPHSTALLDARVGAILRRVPAAPAPPTRVVGELRLDVAAREVVLRGAPLHLARAEFDLLARLAEQPGRVIARADLRQRAAGRHPSADTVDVLLSRLRAKFGETARQPRYLHTVRGRGVVLKAS